VDNIISSPGGRVAIQQIQQMFGVDPATALGIYISLLSDPTYFEALGINRPRMMAEGGRPQRNETAQ
jgi:hypothetical protein